MAGSLEIFTLGRLLVRQGGEILNPALPRKALALLVYLAYTGRPINRSQLAELLWFERSEVQSQANLRTLLTRLRPQLGPYLLIGRDTVALSPSQGCWLDVAELKQGLAEFQRFSNNSEALTSDAAKRLETMLELYQGEFLEESLLPGAPGFEEWVIREREHLHRQVIEGLGVLIRYFEARQDYQRDNLWTARLLQLDPLMEEAHRRRMWLLARSGERRKALAHYKSYQRFLASELDIAPEAATTDLYEHIRRGDFRETIQPEGETIRFIKEKETGLERVSKEERLRQLKRVSIFSETPEPFMEEIARLLEEVIVGPGQTIFDIGEHGQCMYIVAEGKLRVHKGQHILNDLSERDIFGEMALLDASPRLASVTALTPARLWRLDQEPFYKLMDGHIEISRGVIRLLLKRLRDRVEDLVELEERTWTNPVKF